MQGCREVGTQGGSVVLMAASHHVEDARGRAAWHLPISHADDEAERTVERRQVTQGGESVALAAWREHEQWRS